MNGYTLLTFRRAALTLMAFGVVACGGEQVGEAGVEEDASLAELPDVESQDQLRWEGVTEATSTRVVVYPATENIIVGMADFMIEFEEALPDSAAVTVDLLSPAMPAHGILRFETHKLPNNMYHVGVDIPMEGLWALWVNLDAGVDAVGWEFEVEAGDGMGASGHDHEGGGMPSASDAASSGGEADHGGHDL